MQTRDQQRALYAYRCVQPFDKDQLKAYKVHVDSFGANLLKSGLATALSFLERERKARDKKEQDEASIFLDHLKSAGIPGIEKGKDESIGAQVRKLETEQYILASREARKIAIWFRRAVQAQGAD